MIARNAVFSLEHNAPGCSGGVSHPVLTGLALCPPRLATRGCRHHAAIVVQSSLLMPLQLDSIRIHNEDIPPRLSLTNRKEIPRSHGSFQKPNDLYNWPLMTAGRPAGLSTQKSQYPYSDCKVRKSSTILYCISLNNIVFPIRNADHLYL